MSTRAGPAPPPEQVAPPGRGGHGDRRAGRVPPGPEHPERAALPLHLRPAAAALFDRLPLPPPGGAGDAAAAGVDAVRARLAEVLPAGTEITVDAYRARLAAGCPASAAGDAEFRWTPAGAARHLGLRALALSVAGDGPGSAARPVEQAVGAVMAELVAAGGERTPGPWLASLDPAGRAVAQAQALRWAEQAVAWLPLRLLDRRSLRFLEDDWWPGGARGSRRLVVHGRRDLTLDLGGRRVAVSVVGGMAGDPGGDDADAVCALAATLCDPRGRLVRVVRVHPTSGEVVAVDVTADLLQRGVDVVERTASALAAAAAGAVPTRPGQGCRWCHRLSACGPGTAEVGRPGRRSMGLPLPGWPAAEAAPREGAL